MADWNALLNLQASQQFVNGRCHRTRKVGRVWVRSPADLPK